MAGVSTVTVGAGESEGGENAEPPQKLDLVVQTGAGAALERRWSTAGAPMERRWSAAGAPLFQLFSCFLCCGTPKKIGFGCTNLSDFAQKSSPPLVTNVVTYRHQKTDNIVRYSGAVAPLQRHSLPLFSFFDFQKGKTMSHCNE